MKNVSYKVYRKTTDSRKQLVIQREQLKHMINFILENMILTKLDVPSKLNHYTALIKTMKLEWNWVPSQKVFKMVEDDFQKLVDALPIKKKEDESRNVPINPAKELGKEFKEGA